MSIIIPYENNWCTNGGGFITPSGDILYTHNDHSKFAMDYCLGSIPLDTFQASQTFNSNLTKEQLKLARLWLTNCKTENYSHALVDFLVYVLQYDKVQTTLNRSIITTYPNPHVRLFNYYLMDWSILKYSPKKYSPQFNSFIIPDYYYISTSEDMECEEEINDIKKHIRKDDRHLFFR